MNNSGVRGSLNIRKLVYIAILTALVVVLQTVGILTGAATGLSVNLSLVPIVVGAALCGRGAGAWLGLVSGIVVLFDPATAAFLYFSDYTFIPTVLLCLLKGAMSGFVASVVYKLLERKGKTLATLVAGIVAPFVNTSIFIIGCLTIFYDYVNAGSFGETLLGLLGLFIVTNFIIELLSSVVLSPAIVRIVNTRNKT